MRKTAFRAALSGLAVLFFLSLVVLAQSPQGKNISQLEDVRTQLTALALNPSIQFEYGVPIKVAKAVDGDTLQLINGETVRYIGIDTPEKNHPTKPEQCYAREASAANMRFVEGKEVTIYKDVNEKDMYGRWLGFIYLSDGTFVNEKLVREGYAFAYHYKPDISKSPQFNAAEVAAKQEGLGLWSQCNVRSLSSGRKQTNDLK